MAAIWRFFMLVYLVQSFTVYGEPKYVDFIHHDYSQMTDVLKNLNEAYPKITLLYSLGETQQGRKLWVMEISDNPGVHEPGEPEFKYIGNMHGNEVVSREILLHLIEHLLQGYNGKDSSITSLVNSSRIHIMPSMNPDGYEIAKTKPSCGGVTGRRNSLSVDLNRDFPDQFAPNKRDDSDVQIETHLLMNWIRQNPFVLSANFHGGSLVANYPFDDRPNRLSDYSASPDDDVFRELAMTYSKNHKTMSLKKMPCHEYSDTFKDGITNGAAWYSVSGGMQDYNYVNSNCFEITVEVSCCKFPSQSELEGFWNDNKDALLAYLDFGLTGLKGFVKDHAGNGINGAQIEVLDRDHPVKSAKDGDYWRLLLPGTYNITVSSDGFAPVERSVNVTGGPATVENFTLHHSVLSDDDRLKKEGTQLLEDKRKGEQQALSVPLVVGLTVICIISLLLALGLAVMMAKRYRAGNNRGAGYSKVNSGP